MKTFPNGHSYVGTWQDGRMHGEGTYFWKDGSEYDGEFRNGVPAQLAQDSDTFELILKLTSNCCTGHLTLIGSP